MKKTTIKVFGVIAVLVLIFLIWQLVFNDGGIIRTGYNAMANGINGQWEKVAGDGQTLLPLWDAAVTGDDSDGGFDIDVG